MHNIWVSKGTKNPPTVKSHNMQAGAGFRLCSLLHIFWIIMTSHPVFPLMVYKLQFCKGQSFTFIARFREKKKLLCKFFYCLYFLWVTLFKTRKEFSLLKWMTRNYLYKPQHLNLWLSLIISLQSIVLLGNFGLIKHYCKAKRNPTWFRIGPPTLCKYY